MNIKICGITDIGQLRQLDELGVDYAGLIFYPGSKRYVLDKLPGKLVKQTPTHLKKTGVFVNPVAEDVLVQIEEYGLDAIQLHGEETPAFCQHFRKHVEVIKAFRLNSTNEASADWMTQPYQESCDYFLFDTLDTNNYGGTGSQFNWKALEGSQVNKHFFLSGGIGVQDLPKIKGMQHPFLYGVDINSRIEISPGVKDLEKVAEIKQQLSEA
jgi:phosphoribosylanthranilate isomerase